MGIDGKKDTVLLGMKDEVLLIDMIYMDEREVELIIDFVHKIAWKELLSRSIQSMWDWSSRANILFMQYDFSKVGHLVVLSKSEVNNLHGCGYKTRREIYDTYRLYGLTMSNWLPSEYYEKKNYVF